MRRVIHEKKRYLVAAAERQKDSPCELCCFDADDTCPWRWDKEQKAKLLLCVIVDDLPIHQTAYFVRDNKQGRAEWIARKLEQ